MKKWILTLNFLFLGFLSYAQSLQVIPKPAEVIRGNDGPFLITPKTPIFFISGRIMANVIEFNSLLKQIHGMELPWTTEVTDANQKLIYLELIKDSLISDEGYQFISQSEFIKITATHRHGLFYGLTTLLQLMQPSLDCDGAFSVPACTINDQPRFKYRGMHLDVCRHYFGKEFIKKYIDLLAIHKLNTFHWHLTEDQGWRMEIKKYPRLTEIGAWRNGSMIGHYRDHQLDTIRYGGFYSQDDIREIVKYAESRHVTIIPEIEMPGHALAALAAYPEFSCNGGPFEVGKEWGVFDDVYCAGNESTYKFLEDVLTEVCNLFPGKYIHIGGDECPKTRWKSCAKCQKKIKDLGLKDEHELQSYFIQRIEKFLNSKGKQIIGWDEILEGGLAPNATVMSWRGEQGGIDAATQQHHVIMTPGEYCYFDHYQGNPELEPIAIGGFTPIEKVYSYNPVPKELSDSLHQFILGAQANVWTEYILNEKHVEYMAFPRATALAEVLWTPEKLKDFDDFQIRLLSHFNLLDKLKVNYANSLYQVKLEVIQHDNHVGIVGSSIFKQKGIQVSIVPLDATTDDFKTIHGDGSTGPIFIKQSSLVKCKLEGSNSVSEQTIVIHKATGKPIEMQPEPDQRYNFNAGFTLVNGVKAKIPRQNKEWNAWLGEDVEITIDLQMVNEIEKITIGCLEEKENWIWLPLNVGIWGSTNGKKFKFIQNYEVQNILNNSRELILPIKKQKFRWITVKLKNPGKIPEGYPGSGENSWMFIDEIQIE